MQRGGRNAVAAEHPSARRSTVHASCHWNGSLIVVSAGRGAHLVCDVARALTGVRLLRIGRFDHMRALGDEEASGFGVFLRTSTCFSQQNCPTRLRPRRRTRGHEACKARQGRRTRTR
jgi:hypothetical protein